MIGFVAALVVASSLTAIPPPPRGHWIVDQTGTVTPAAFAEVDRIAGEVDASGAGQLGVLVVRTTSGAVPRAFATQVFNEWGVGHAGKNDGILLFVATDDRKAEIILGDGCGVTSAQTDVVMREQVVANMKRGDLPGALEQASRALAQLLRTANAPTADPLTPQDNVGLGPDRYDTAPVQDVVIEQTETRFREATAAVLRDVPSGGELAERATARPRDCASHRARLSKSERDRRYVKRYACSCPSKSTARPKTG